MEKNLTSGSEVIRLGGQYLKEYIWDSVFPVYILVLVVIFARMGNLSYRFCIIF